MEMHQFKDSKGNVLLETKDGHPRAANLSGADLEGKYLFCIDMRGANLTQANLSFSNLEGADLEGANMRGCDLRGADMTRARLRKANLEGCCLRNCDIRGANLEGACLRKTNFSGAYMSPLIIGDGEDGEGPGSIHVKLAGADLRYSKLCKTNLRGADMRGCDLRWAEMPMPGMMQ